MVSKVDHSMMNLSTDHSMMNHSMDHSTMNHTVDHSTMNHTVDHSTMNHSDPHAGMDHAGMDHANHDTAGHTMQMYFHTGITEYILFESLKTDSTGGLVGACVVMFSLSLLYEGLKFFREYLLRRANNPGNVYAPSSEGITFKQPEVGSRMLTGSHGLQTFLHMVQVFVSYCLMLVFMTYNVWLCLAVILGAGFGYFIFGWRRAMVVDLNEHCH